MLAPALYAWLVAARSPQGARYVARGLAIGVFWCCIPIFILHWPCALATAYLFRSSRLAASAGVCLSNPLTIPPQYSLAWVLGHAVTPFGSGGPVTLFTEDTSLREALMSLGWGDFGAMLVGGALLGCVLSVPAYLLAMQWLENRRGKRQGSATPVVVVADSSGDGD